MADQQQPQPEQQSPKSTGAKPRKPRVCSLPNCDNPGILVCPTCQEQRREKYWVCCQEHLVECWPIHSPVHLEPLPVRVQKKRSEAGSVGGASAEASPSGAGPAAAQEQQPQEEQPQQEAVPAAQEQQVSAAPVAAPLEATAEVAPVQPVQAEAEPVVKEAAPEESAAAAPAAQEEEQKEQPVQRAPIAAAAPVAAQPPAAAEIPTAQRPAEVWTGREGNCRWRYEDQKWGPQKPTSPGYLSITAQGLMTVYEKSDKKKTVVSYPIKNSIVCVVQRLVPTEFMFRFQPDALSGKFQPIVFHPTHKDLRVEWCESFRRAGAAVCRPIHEGRAEVPKKFNKKKEWRSYHCILYADHLEFLKEKTESNIKSDLLIPLTGVTVQSEDDPKLAQKNQFGWTVMHSGEPLVYMLASSPAERQQWVDALNGRLDPKYRFTTVPNEDIATAYEKWLDPLADAGALLIAAAASRSPAMTFGEGADGSGEGSAADGSGEVVAPVKKAKAPLEQLDPVSVDNKCQRTLCQNDRVLVCPTCQSLNLGKFWVCSQECLQKCWKAHKAAHKATPVVAAAGEAAQEQ